MKTLRASSFLLLSIAFGTPAFAETPAGGAAAAETPTAARQNEYYRKYNQILEEQQKGVRHNVELVDKSFTRQVELQDRFEKILERWEKQQDQYQKYLDTLNK